MSAAARRKCHHALLPALLASTLLVGSTGLEANPGAAPLPPQPRVKPDRLDAETWTGAVGFSPESAPGGQGEWSEGDVVDAAKREAYRAWVADGVAVLVREHGLTLPTACYRPIHPSAGYMAATLKHWGKAKARDTGEEDFRAKGIEGYVAGLPFPRPRSGLEVAFNLHFAYQGDDGGLHFGVHWIDDSLGVWKSEQWRWIFISRTTHRTDLEPIPEMEWFADRDIQYASVAYADVPGAKDALRALFYRFEEPRDQRGYVYIPTTRRSLKLVSGTPGVPWNVTDLLNEDVRGFGGYPEWMRWKMVGRRTILAPMHAGPVLDGERGAEAAFDFEQPPHWNPKVSWEPRPVYVVEASHKFWTSPYPRVVLYVDAETFLVPLKEAYDAEGKLWKVFVNAYNESADIERVPPDLALSLAVDVQARHATALTTYSAFHNVGLERGRFTESSLRRFGR